MRTTFAVDALIKDSHEIREKKLIKFFDMDIASPQGCKASPISRLRSVVVWTLIQLMIVPPLALWSPKAYAECVGINPAPPVEISAMDGQEAVASAAPPSATNEEADRIADQGAEIPMPDIEDDVNLFAALIEYSRSGDNGDGGGANKNSVGGDYQQSVPIGMDRGPNGNPHMGGKNAYWWMPQVQDPIDLTTADKGHVQVDYLSVGASAVRLARVYHSNLSYFNAQVTVPMGTGWRMFYDRSVQVVSASQVRMHRANGRAIDFTWNGAAWVSGEPVGQLGSIVGGWTYINERDVVETYNSAGRLLTMTSAGHATTLQYDGSNRLWRVVNPFGRAISFSYDNSGRVSTVTLPSGGALVYGYGSNNNLISVRFADNSVRQYVYENAGYPNALTGVIDESNRRTVTWSYDTQGRPNGGYYGDNVDPLSVQYGSGIVTTTDARNTQRVRYVSAVAGKPAITAIQTLATADSSTTGWSVTYAATGVPSRITSRTGEIIDIQSDGRGLTTSVARASGSASSINTNTTWHPTWRKPQQVTAAGVTFNNSIDSAGRMVQTTRSAPGESTQTIDSRVYNAQNLLSSQTDARGGTTTYTYDAQGNRTGVTDPQGRTTTFGNFNAHGQAGQVIRSDGTVITRVFDTRGRLISRTDSGLTTQFQYDAAGRFATITYPDGTWKSFGYTNAGHLVSTNNHRSETTIYTRDVTSAVTRVDVYNASGARVRTANQGFDAVGRLATSTDSRGYTHRVLYDSATARSRGFTDPTGRTVNLALDILGRTTAVTQPNTAAMVPVTGPTRTTTHTYSQDGRGRHVNTSDTNAINTGYGHDGFNRQKTEVSVDAGTRSVTLNAAGDVLTASDARAVTVTRTLDALGRVTAITPPSGTGYTFGYVPNRSDSLLAQMTYPMGSTNWTYDSAGRALSKTQNLSGLVRQITIARDALGRPATLTYPSGMQVAVSYSGDAVSAIRINGTVLLDNITYSPFSQAPTGWRWGNGTYHTRTVDLDGRITSAKLGPSKPLTFN